MQVDRCLEAEFVSPLDSKMQIRSSADNATFEIEDMSYVPVT
jgi:hypothetical protein